MRAGQWAAAAGGLVLIALTIASVAGNLLAVDLGSGYLKVAVARPGRGLELVTNEASKRKTPMAVAFTLDGERLFGDPALAYAPKAPLRAILDPLGFLGNTSARVEIPAGASPSAPALSLTGVDLVAMILSLARQHAAAALGTHESTVRDTVVTVPSWFSAPHRAALADAATVSGLNVLALVNSNAAAALKYALDNKASVSPTASATASAAPGSSPSASSSGGGSTEAAKDAHFALFVDVGAGSTVATVVQIDNKKAGRSSTKLPSAVSVLSHGWDRTLGGRALDDVIVARLVAAFDKQRGVAAESDESASRNPRVVTRLRKEAQKVREMLSANVEAHVAVPSLVGDVDLTSTVVSRADFEADAAPLLARITAPVTRALASAGVTTDQLDAVVPLGGASRTPKLQQLLCEALGRPALNKSVNADEAAVMGAAFLAASLSPTFRVRALDLADVSPRAVSVAVRREPGAVIAGVGDYQNATLFAAGSKRPATKKLTVRRKGDFTLSLFLEPLPASPEDAAAENPSDAERTLYGRYTISGVSKVFTKRRATASEMDASPKITLSFSLDHSGLVRVEAAEATLEETVWTTPMPTPTPSVDASADAKSKKKASAKESASPSGSPKPVAKTLIHRQALDVSEVAAIAGDTDGNVGGWRLSEPDLAASRKTLAALDAAANDRTARADALNSLEGLVLQARASLRLGGDDSEALEAVSTEEEREALIAQLDAAEDWMFTEAAGSTDALTAKKKEVSGAVSPLFKRAAEYAARPAAVAALREALEQSASLVGAARAARAAPTEDTEVAQAAAEKVLAAAEAAAAEASAWLAGVEAAAVERPATGDAGFTVSEVDDRAAAVRRASGAVRKLPPPLPVVTPTGAATSEEPAAAGSSPSPSPDASGGSGGDEL